MNTAQKACVLVGIVVAFVAFALAVVLPVHWADADCGAPLRSNVGSLREQSAAFEEKARGYGVRATEGSSELARLAERGAELLDTAADNCSGMLRTRLTISAVVFAGGAILGVGGYLVFRDAKTPPTTRAEGASHFPD